MLNELLKKSRSVRSFDMTKRVSREELCEMLETVRLCPSTANLQALKFRLVSEPDECKKVLENTGWAGYLSDMRLPPENREPTAYIIVCLDTEISSNTELFNKDVGIVSQTIMLKACEMGYGGCMIGTFNEKNISAELKIATGYKISLVLALGKPDEKISVCDCEASGDIKYFRKNGIHFVPKRSLTELIIK